MHTLKEHLAELAACEEAIEWVDDKSLAEAWATCSRGDWMLWLAQKAGVGIRQITLAKAECAALAIPYMEHEASWNAVEVARKFGKEEATKEELDAADAAAYAAYAADAAYAAVDAADAYAAAYAADAAAYAAVSAYAAAADAAAYAAYAAAYAAYATYAAYAAYAAAKGGAFAQCADIVREIITIEMLNMPGL